MENKSDTVEHDVNGAVEAFGLSETPHSGVKFPVFLIAFCVLAVFAFAYVAITEMRGLTTSFAEDGRTGIHLESLRGQIRYLNEGMTMSAHLGAVTGKPAWETRYKQLSSQLDETIDETIRLQPSGFSDEVLDRMMAAKASLNERTRLAFALAAKGKLTEANDILSIGEYPRQLQIFNGCLGIFSQKIEDLSLARAKQEARQSRFTYAEMILALMILTSGTMLFIRLAQWHKSLLKRVNHERERSAAVLESISDAFFSVDKHWCFLYANKRARSILKVSVEPQLGETLWSSFPDLRDTGFEKAAYSVMSRHQEVTHEEKLESLGRWIEFQIYPSAEGISCYFRDVTHRKLSEEAVVSYTNQLEYAKSYAEQQTRELAMARDEALAATRSKSVFLANMSHEIRTPMNGVIGMTSLLLETSLTADQRECLATVRNSAESLLTIINDILDLSKLEAGKVELERINFDLKTLTTEVVSMLGHQARQKGLTLETNFDPSLPDALIGDPIRIRQILTNVMSNAIKFTEEGSVTLAVAIQNQWQNAVTLRIAVTDTGIGIPKDRLERVFDSFTQADSSTTRRFGGTGLGLTICKQIADLMGGTMRVTSELGKGSTFWVELQMQIGDPTCLGCADTSTAETFPVRSVRGLRILLVEDNKVNQKVAVSMLQTLGCTVDVADNGAQGLEKWERETYDLILMDMQMPVMDGCEASTIIRTNESGTDNHIPIVALTANAMQGDRDRCLASGMDDYLAKPVQKSALERVLAQWTRPAGDEEVRAA